MYSLSLAEQKFSVFILELHNYLIAVQKLPTCMCPLMFVIKKYNNKKNSKYDAPHSYRMFDRAPLSKCQQRACRHSNMAR